MCIIDLSTIALQSQRQLLWLPLHTSNKVKQTWPPLQTSLIKLVHVILENCEEIQRW